MSKLDTFIVDHEIAKRMIENDVNDVIMRTVLVETIDSLLMLARAVKEDYNDGHEDSRTETKRSRPRRKADKGSRKGVSSVSAKPDRRKK